MKKIASILLLALVLLVSESFTGKSAGKSPAESLAPAYSLTIDAAPFDARAANSYTAQLINNSKTASITLFGNEVRDKAGNVYPTKIQIDYTNKADALGEVNVERVSYEYNGQTYNGLPGTAFMSITKMKLSADKRSCVMCADLFCKVQKSYVMEEFVPVLVIRGQLQNLTVNAPAL